MGLWWRGGCGGRTSDMGCGKISVLVVLVEVARAPQTPLRLIQGARGTAHTARGARCGAAPTISGDCCLARHLGAARAASHCQITLCKPYNCQ